jgi:replication-associated recombination protein RarA
VAKVLERTLREKVVITEKGQRKTITKLEAAVKQLVNKAASGDQRALQSLLKLSREAESPERQSQPTNQAPGEIDQKVMEGILRRIQAAKNDEGGQK